MTPAVARIFLTRKTAPNILPVYIQWCSHQVVLESGDEIPYDALVLATGTRHLSPFKYDPDVADENVNKDIMKEMADKVLSSSMHAPAHACTSY